MMFGKIVFGAVFCSVSTIQGQVLDCAEDLGTIRLGLNDSIWQTSGRWGRESCNAYTRSVRPAAYFTFQPDSQKSLIITLKAASSPRLTLFRIHDEDSKDFEIIAMNDINVRTPNVARLRLNPEQDGSYSIETSPINGEPGEFTLSIGCYREYSHVGILRGELYVKKKGRWTQEDCFSYFRPGRLARYFSFNITSRQRLLICVKKVYQNDPNPYLTLFQEGPEYREVLQTQGRSNRRKTCFRRQTFERGFYKLEVTPLHKGRTGNFQLSFWHD